jgi:hypothetical protein
MVLAYGVVSAAYTVVRLSGLVRMIAAGQDQWDWLIKGVDWQRLSAPAPAHWHV